MLHLASFHHRVTAGRNGYAYLTITIILLHS